MKLNLRSIAFNGAAAMLFVGLLAYMIRSLFVSEPVLPCSARYDSPNEFVLERGNAPMTPVQLLGVIGASSRNVLSNAKVVRVAGLPSGHALKVSLAPDTPDAEREGAGNGIGFSWTPRAFAGATAACLSYSVYLPKDFEPGEGGMLPGLYGGKAIGIDEFADGDTALTQRVSWRRDGIGSLLAQSPESGTTSVMHMSAKGFALATGRWIAIEQEIILNTPGNRDGLSRVFVDGEMVLERKYFPWRNSADLALSGVTADVTYAAPLRKAQPPKPTAIYVSPLQLRWQ